MVFRFHNVHGFGFGKLLSDLRAAVDGASATELAAYAQEPIAKLLAFNSGKPLAESPLEWRLKTRTTPPLARDVLQSARQWLEKHVKLKGARE
jgi:hypothetical protein